MPPQEVRKLTEKVEEQQQVIGETRDHARQLEYDNVTLQAQRDIYRDDLQVAGMENSRLVERYVDHVRDPGKDNIAIIVRKQTTQDSDKYHHLPYYVARIQRRKRYTKLRWFERHFPNYDVIVELDSPNAIHAFNRLEDEEHIERKYNNFRLVDLTQEELYGMGIPGIDME